MAERVYLRGQLTAVRRKEMLAEKLARGMVCTDYIPRGQNGNDVAYFRQGTSDEIESCWVQLGVALREKYDQKYDMAASSLSAPVDVDAAISMSSNDMREAGVEPAFLSEPDPKSHRGSQSTDSGALPVGSSATERHAPTANAADSTTESTTGDDEGGSEGEPPSGRLVATGNPLDAETRLVRRSAGGCY